MTYKIKKINRNVTLDDDIVKEFCKYSELRDSIFTIILRSRYKNGVSEQQISNEELSSVCNEILTDELKAIAMLPAALSTYSSNINVFKDATSKQKCVEVNIKAAP